MKYQTKPAVIEAFQFRADMIAFPPGFEHINAKIANGAVVTLMDRTIALDGDWIIKAEYDTFHPCSDELFQLTFEPKT